MPVQIMNRGMLQQVIFPILFIAVAAAAQPSFVNTRAIPHALHLPIILVTRLAIGSSREARQLERALLAQYGRPLILIYGHRVNVTIMNTVTTISIAPVPMTSRRKRTLRQKVAHRLAVIIHVNIATKCNHLHSRHDLLTHGGLPSIHLQILLLAKTLTLQIHQTRKPKLQTLAACLLIPTANAALILTALPNSLTDSLLIQSTQVSAIAVPMTHLLPPAITSLDQVLIDAPRLVRLQV